MTNHDQSMGRNSFASTFDVRRSMFDVHSRRAFLKGAAGGIGSAALATLLADESPAAVRGLPHFAPRAKRVIYLFMAGGPSHIDLFDYKPVQRKLHGSELPDSIRQGQRLTGMTSGQSTFPCVAPMFKFQRYGERGTWMNSETLPHISTIADDIAIIKSMNTEAINHDPAITFITTGREEDIDEILETHVKKGGRVERLMLQPSDKGVPAK